MQKLDTAPIEQGVINELNREGYPDNFPALPEIPTARYADPAFHDLELKHFWPKTWINVGHVSQLPDPGSYFLFKELGYSIIISRGTDGDIRAFHNICRHRASAVLLEETGNAKRFICPYHSWGYAGDGKLVSVPEQRDFACLNKAERGLLPVRSGIWRGMIYLNIDGQAEPLASYIEPIARQWVDFPLEDMVVKGVFRFEMDCNWKAAYDNFLEIYHLTSVHQNTLAPFLDSRSFSASMFRNGHARFVTRKRKGETIFKLDDAPPEGLETFMMEHTIALPMFPNAFTAIDPVGFNWQTFWPTSSGKSVLVARLMGRKGDSPEDKALWEKMGANVAEILSEDLQLFGDIQRNYESGLMPGAILSYQERALYWYQEEIDRVIGADKIPPYLRMKQVLAPHMDEQP